MTGLHRFAFALLAATSTAALAAEPAPATSNDSVDGAQLAAAEPIVVTGQRSQYGVRATASATKTNTPVKNIPQALTIVSSAQIADQQLRSVADLLNFVPGAS